MVGRLYRWFGSGRETLPEVKNRSVDLPGGPKWSGDPPRVVEVGRRPSQRSGSGWETLPKIRKWSGDPPGGAEVGRETLPEVRRW